MALNMLDRSLLEQALKLIFHANNNEAKYEMLLTGLRAVAILQVR